MRLDPVTIFAHSALHSPQPLKAIDEGEYLHHAYRFRSLHSLYGVSMMTRMEGVQSLLVLANRTRLSVAKQAQQAVAIWEQIAKAQNSPSRSLAHEAQMLDALRVELHKLMRMLETLPETFAQLHRKRKSK